MPQDEPTEIRVDSKAAIDLAKNPVYHEKSKHIDMRYHSIREHIKRGEVSVVKVTSKEQAADILTKALPKASFEEGKRKLGMCRLGDLSIEEGCCEMSNLRSPDRREGAENRGGRRPATGVDHRGSRQRSAEKKSGRQDAEDVGAGHRRVRFTADGRR